jgi:hypothetical protein
MRQIAIELVGLQRLGVEIGAGLRECVRLPALVTAAAPLGLQCWGQLLDCFLYLFVGRDSDDGCSRSFMRLQWLYFFADHEMCTYYLQNNALC